jgi:hypothetical protein
MNVCAAHSALKQRPMTVNRACVMDAPYVFFRFVIDGPKKLAFGGKAVVPTPLIGADSRASLDVMNNVSLKRRQCRVANLPSSHPRKHAIGF